MEAEIVGEGCTSTNSSLCSRDRTRTRTCSSPDDVVGRSIISDSGAHRRRGEALPSRESSSHESCGATVSSHVSVSPLVGCVQEDALTVGTPLDGARVKLPETKEEIGESLPPIPTAVSDPVSDPFIHSFMHRLFLCVGKMPSWNPCHSSRRRTTLNSSPPMNSSHSRP